jgi:hypothetical protein
LITLISGTKQAGVDIDVFRTIDGGHAKALGTWGQCMGWVQERTLQSKGHYFFA